MRFLTWFRKDPIDQLIAKNKAKLIPGFEVVDRLKLNMWGSRNAVRYVNAEQRRASVMGGYWPEGVRPESRTDAQPDTSTMFVSGPHQPQ